MHGIRALTRLHARRVLTQQLQQLAHRRHAASLAVPLGAALGMAAGMAVPVRKWMRQPAELPEEAVLAADLGRCLHANDAEAIAAAWERIDKIFAAPRARVLGVDLGEMVKALGRHGFASQRLLVDRAVSAGFSPDTRTLNELLTRMQLEAHPISDLHALQMELATLGAVADGETQRVLSRSEEELERMRAALLRSLLRREERIHADGSRPASSKLYEAWMKAGAARASHLNLMLRNACVSSEEQRRMITNVTTMASSSSSSGADDDGSGGGLLLMPDVASYTTLIWRLHLEGAPKGVVEGVLEEMKARGIEKDEALMEELHVEEEVLSRRRTGMLMRFVVGNNNHQNNRRRGSDREEEQWSEEEGDGQQQPPRRSRPHPNDRVGVAKDASRAFDLFDLLLRNKAADQYQLGVMLSKASASADEMRNVLAHAESHGLQPATAAFNALLKRMALEGTAPDKLAAVLDEMQRRGVMPDGETERIIELPAADLSAMRTAELKRRQQANGDSEKYGSEADQRAAWELFSTLCENGVVEWYQVNAMRAAARRYETGEAPSMPDERRHHANFLVALQRVREQRRAEMAKELGGGGGEEVESPQGRGGGLWSW